jgi:hypothetical protein
VRVGDALRSAEVEHDPVGSQYGRDDVGETGHAPNGFNRELNATLDVDATVLVNAVHQRFKVDDNHNVGAGRRCASGLVFGEFE